MATIAKRTDNTGKTRYQVKVRIKGHPAQSATFDRLTDAKKWAEQIEAAIRERGHFKTAEAQKHRVRELCECYIRVVLPTKAAGTQAAQVQQIEWWSQERGAYTLAGCTPALTAEARDEPATQPRARGQCKTPATVARYLVALSHAFTVAVKEWGWIEDNPARMVTKPKEPRGRVRFLSDHERDRLLVACEASGNRHLYPVVVLALSTG